MIKIKTKRKLVAKNIRIPIVAVLSLIIIISSYSAYATSQQPTTIEKTVPIKTYTQTCNFDYTAFLLNNTVYESKIIRANEEKTIFKKITDHVDGFITYNFNSNKIITINGQFTILAKLETDLWSKTYTIIPKTEFKTNYFEAEFPINYTNFENILNQINEEIGVVAQNPVLIIECDIGLTETSNEKTTFVSFTPSLNVSLGGSTLEISGDLRQTDSGNIEEIQTIQQPVNTNQMATLIFVSIFSAIMLMGFLLFTKNETIETIKIGKQLNKIMKKYGEWIVDVEKPLKISLDSEVVSCKTIEDLMKISEELGKPVIHHELDNSIHTFHILDETVHYQYILSDGRKISKTIRDPESKTKIKTEGTPV